MKCCMCKKDGESVDYLLLQYIIDCELWSLVSCIFGVLCHAWEGNSYAGFLEEEVCLTSER